jgi:predicted metal-dependent enzyme (double-stranded beta helix superfamily)
MNPHRTTMKNPLGDFIEAAESVIRLGRTPKDTVVAIEPMLRCLLLEPGWLNEQHCRVIPSKPYAQHLLHRPADHAFSIVSFVWNPGQSSPIHDHCTWGVIGQYQGEEEETRFRFVDNRLERIGVALARPGDVSHVYPPSRDIHQISNRTNKPTISIHIYGGDIGSQQRHAYDPNTGAMRDFVSGYDSVPSTE